MMYCNAQTLRTDVYFDDVTASLTPSPVVETTDYNSFGLVAQSFQRQSEVSQNFKYNGKEQINDLGLDWADYGARMYMPEIGRWGVMDPLAQLYYSTSPYAYVVNNPINAYDIDGRKIIYVNGYFSRILNMAGLAPGAPKEDYWNFFSPSFISSSRQFMGADGEASAFIDGSSYFGGDQSGGDRYELGKQYAQEHYAELIQGMGKGETFKFVSHSEGGAFAAGMADYLKSKGLTVESMLYLSPDEADEFSHPLGIFSIQSHFENDPVSPSMRLNGVNVYMNSSTLDGSKVSKSQAHGSTVSTANINRMKSVLGKLGSDVMKLFGSAQWNVTETKTGYTFRRVEEKKEDENEEH